MTGRPLAAGELIMLIDRKKRRYLTTLVEGGEFHSHAGALPHDHLIGQSEGQEFRSGKNAAYLVVRPTLSDFVLKMKRGAQVIYPKDLGPILMHADIFPGARVLESGLGSGALSMTLLRAGADITGYELRDDFAAQAVANVTEFLGEGVLDRYDVHVRSAYEEFDHGDFDRIVLDLPEPWSVVPHAANALASGGIILAYTPSIVQATTFRARLAEHGFGMAETIEVLNRGWHIEPEHNAVRPDHRMVAHTGFLTTARRLVAPPAVDNAFSVPRLAALYDEFEGDRPDLAHYERIAVEFGATSVLDLGCGTGTLASRLAASGLEVHGVDPAGASIEIARGKHDGVDWIVGDVTTLPALQVDLAVMTGNTAQVFLNDADWLAMLRRVRAALRPGGRIVFEVRDPAYRGWEEWTPEKSRRTTTLDDGDRVTSSVELTDVSLPLVSFRWTFVFQSDGAELTSDSTLRFRSRSEIETTLVEAGYTLEEVRGAPDRPDKEFVFIAQA